MPKPGEEGSSVHRKLPKVRRVQTDDERVDEDLRVAKFYMRDDNLPGAYLRAKDAVKVQPEYSETHFALAEIAQKMKKKEEAVAEYQTYLKLDPDGEKAKAAQRALDELK
jgi:Tfp pilus assembly protein PilF